LIGKSDLKAGIESSIEKSDLKASGAYVEIRMFTEGLDMKELDSAVIEFTNDAFYLAFNNRDLAQMDALWAIEHSTVCIHPGWDPLMDREEIMQSWENIFSGESGSNMQCHGARVVNFGGVYSVICYEELPGGWLVATNTYLLEKGEVKMVHHQASHCVNPPEIEDLPQTLQ
jgi:hypothetical protein